MTATAVMYTPIEGYDVRDKRGALLHIKRRVYVDTSRYTASNLQEIRAMKGVGRPVNR
jgi:hypothetical protein